MKLTLSKCNWVIDKVARYSKLLQIAPPVVYFTMAEYNRWKITERQKSGFKRVGRSNCLGVCHRQDGFIVILVKRSPNFDRLDRTIRHELLHYAKPSYNHKSKEFADRMEKLKKGQIKNGRF